MSYNYEIEVKNDIIEYLEENQDYYDFDKPIDRLVDELRDDVYGLIERVTGNITGSYYCNSYKAEEAICHNMDIIQDAIDDGFCNYESVYKDFSPERIDVIIRYYIFEQVLEEAVEEYLNQGE